MIGTKILAMAVIIVSVLSFAVHVGNVIDAPVATNEQN
jgi:hypothetical protein